MTDQTLTAPSPDRCPRCGAGNRCALAANASIENCWCRATATTLPLPTEAASCYCADCLRAVGAASDTGKGDIDAR